VYAHRFREVFLFFDYCIFAYSALETIVAKNLSRDCGLDARGTRYRHLRVIRMSMAFLGAKIQRINILIGLATSLIRPPTSGYTVSD
jgi:hypothetical protein